jgi:hypothetical protein
MVAPLFRLSGGLPSGSPCAAAPGRASHPLQSFAPHGPTLCAYRNSTDFYLKNLLFAGNTVGSHGPPTKARAGHDFAKQNRSTPMHPGRQAAYLQTQLAIRLKLGIAAIPCGFPIFKTRSSAYNNTISMNTDEAFSFLGLSLSASKEELEASFRQLVMLYHPDRNPDKSEWSHTRMTLLNEAHTLAQHYITLRGENHRAAPKQISREFMARLQNGLYAARDDILEGVHLYYTFSLENVHLRSEGVRRLRYNSAKRGVRKGVIQLEKILQEAPEGKLKIYARLWEAFGKSFYGSMGITKICPADTSLNYKAYKHYRNASLILDSFIKLCFFPEDFPRQNITPKSIELCEQLLLLILSNYRETIWVPEADVKLSLLDNLQNLVEFERRECQ